MTHTVRIVGLMAVPALALGCSSSPPNDTGEDVSSTTRLVQYETCDALEADLKEMLLAEMEAHFDQLEDNFWGGGAEDGNAEPGADADDGGGREEGSDYSGTNNQEDGVDEADFVKTDGHHVYVLNGDRLHIFDVPEFGELSPASTTQIEGWPQQMLVDGEEDRAAVFSAVWPDALPEDHPLRDELGEETDAGWMWRSGAVSKITVLDIEDREQPAVEQELYVEGSYNTARLVDSSVRLTAYSWLNIPGLYDWWWYYSDSDGDIEEAKDRARDKLMAAELSDLIPQIYELAGDDTLTTHSLTESSCTSFRRPLDSHGRGVTSILSFDLGGGFELDADQIVSNHPTFYSSRDYMYIAEPANDWWWFWLNEDDPEQLNLHMFDIGTPGETDYLGSGRVEGLLLNQFAMSEHEGYLRVATTTNLLRWWDQNAEESENHLYVLELDGEELETIGHVGGLAEGERIFAVRMVGDEGYIVTFEMIDPLFTLDLSDPTDPKVVGELKIPGFSTYIHPVADENLLTIGVGGDENGANWRTQVSLFDVGDFASPELSDVEELVMPDDWGWSEALYEHKAFQYWAPKELLAVPLSSYRFEGDQYVYTSKLELVRVDLDAGLSSHGTIDHSHLFNDEPGYWSYRDVRRSIFMGEYIYAISDRGITVHEVDTLEPVTQETLPGTNAGPYAPWGG